MKHCHFIVNPSSAAGRTGRKWTAMVPAVQALFPQAQLHLTRSAGHASQLARDIALGGADLIVSVGGDGTNNEVINGLVAEGRAVQPTVRFATLPMGTGGDLIRSLGMSRQPLEALKQIRAG